MRNASVAPYLWMLCGCFCFVWMSAFAHELGRGCDWRLVALARCSIALLFASALAGAAGARLVLWRPGILWVRSLAGSVSMVCTFYALAHVRPSEVLTLTNTFPLWVAVLSWPLLRQRPGPSVWFAAGCGVLGIVLIQRPHFEGGSRLALPLALVAAFTSAVAMLGLHHLRGIDPRSIVAHFSGVACLVAVAACFVGPPPDLARVLEPRNAWLLFGVGATATVGQLFLTLAFTAGPPAKVSVVGLTQVVFALVLDVALGHPEFSPATLCGIGLVVAPTAWVMVGKAGE